jgi:hypothetical protein
MTDRNDPPNDTEAAPPPPEAPAAAALPPTVWVTGLIGLVLLLLAIFALG